MKSNIQKSGSEKHPPTRIISTFFCLEKREKTVYLEF